MANKKKSEDWDLQNLEIAIKKSFKDVFIFYIYFCVELIY